MDIKCFSCSFFDTCPASRSNDYKCFFEYSGIKAIDTMGENSLDKFVFENNPLDYFSYLGFKEKENYPKVGSYVIIITGGFGGNPKGTMMKVVHIDDDRYICLLHENTDRRYLVEKSEWWKCMFKVEEL